MRDKQTVVYGVAFLLLMLMTYLAKLGGFLQESAKKEIDAARQEYLYSAPEDRQEALRRLQRLCWKHRHQFDCKE